MGLDLGKFLRDRKDQAVRQWQDSVVLDAVSSGTKADNARRANQGTAETVRQRASQSYGNGFSGVMNRARDVVDPNTQADRIKRQANSGLFENYQEQQNRLTNEAMNSQTDRTLPAQFGASGLREMGKFFLKAPGSIANMYGAVAQSENPIAEVAKGIIPGLGVYSDADKRMGHAASQDLQRQANDLNKQIDQKINQNDYIGERQGENKWAVGLGSVAGQLPAQIATGYAGLVNTGVQMASDEYNKAREAGRSNDQALGIGTLQGAASAASEKFGIDKFLPGNGVAGNSVIKVLKRFGTEGGQEAQQRFTQNLIANKTYDPNQGLKDGVFESAIFGGIAGSAMSPIADLANIGTTPNTPAPLTPEVQNKRNNLANAYTTLVDQGRPDQAAYFAREIDQIDNPAPGTLRERIRSAKDMIMPKGEGGYAKNPFYRGDDVAGGLSKEQSEFINDYANMLEGMGAGNGVDITPDGRRISNNVRDASTAGKTMSKQDWFDKARKDIESGKAGFGASDEYKKLAGEKPVKPKNIENPKPVKSDPLDVPKKDLIIRNGGGKAMSIPTNSKGDPLKKANKNKFFDYKSDGTNAVIKPEHKNRVEFYESPFYEGDLLVSVDGKYAGDLVGGAQTKNIYALRDHLERGGKLITDDEHAGLFKSDNVAMSIDPLESLKQEARKYKSAEEFVKSDLVNKNKFDGLDTEEYSPTIADVIANKSVSRKGMVFENGFDPYRASVDPKKLLSPNAEVKNGKVRIYRISEEGGIKPGDYITDNPKYIYGDESFLVNKDGMMGVYKRQGVSNPRVDEAWVSVEDVVNPDADLVLAGKASGKPGEFYYVPKNFTKDSLTDLYNQATQSQPPKSPIESLKQEATPATGARSDYSPENLQANRQIRAKNASSITYADKKTINPDELVTVYRAVPGKAKGGLVEGDWVTPNKEQARLFMKQSWAQDDTGAKIVTKRVKASELRYHADDAKGYVDDELLYVPKQKELLKSSQSQPPKSPIESLKQEATPKYMQDKVTPEGYFTEGRYKDSAYPKNFVAKADIPHTGIKAGDRVALIKGRDGRFDAILSKKYKEKSTGYTISRESFVDPKSFTSSTKGTSPELVPTPVKQTAKGNNTPIKGTQSQPPKSPLKTEPIKVYRGGDVTGLDPNKVTDRGISVATNKENAQWFGGGYDPEYAAKSGKGVQELELSPSAKILDVNDVPKETLDGFKKLNTDNTTLKEEAALMEYARREGYDAVDVAPWGEAEIRVLNPDILQVPQSPPVQKVETPVESKTLYHGTAKGNVFDKFEIKNDRVGVGSNANHQGNAIYLTDSKQAADYFSTQATRNAKLRNKNLSLEEATGGKDVVGDIYKVSLKKGAKVKSLDSRPNSAEAQALQAEGYDAISFPEEAFGAIEGSKASQIKANTVVVFDPNMATINKPKKPFTPISQPVDNLPAVVKQVTKKSPVAQAADEVRAKNGGGLVSNQKEIQQRTQEIVAEQEAAEKPRGNELTPKAYANTFGITEAQAEQEITFNAATRTTKGKDANKLIEAMKSDKKLSDATRKAQESGKELNFYAKKDANGRSVGIETFNPKTHRIEAGFVVDERGNVLGNHIKVDETGVQVNVGGDLINMDSIIGNPLEWGSTSKRTGEKKGKYKLSETMSRNIDNNAPTPEIANTTKRFLWSSKVKAEANMRTELDAEFTALDDRIKRTNKARPSNVSKEQYKDDIFATLNGDKTDAEIEAEYKPNAAQAILTYKKETRTLYDSLLKRINAERVKFGQEPITPRKDYITHLQEMNQNKGFVTEVYGQMKNSFADEGMGKTRNGVPGDIAGRTENFKPISKYNPFLQRREGTKSLRDPFMAVQEYLQPALYNIHMTEPGARARAVETAFRTAEQLKQMDTRSVATEMESTLKKYQNTSSDNSKLITGFQEYANAVAGKTQRFDRQVTDSSDAAAKSLKVWQGLQRIGGRGTILGNISSILAQPLNQVVGIADAGGINYAKGIAEYMGGDSQIDKSDFIRARETEATKPLRGTGEKILDAGSVPLQAVELASVKLMWHTQHQKALSEGYTGQEAVQQADMNTERLVAGRGIADKPELYRSTVANGVYQYTLEVNAQNKAFWQDLDTKQKVKFMVAASATNALMGAITGFEPLPDFLKAIFETGKDIIDPEDDRSVARKLGGGVQRMGDEYAGMNPLISGIANILPQDTRKAVFGQDSQLGRFAGGSAPIQVVKNTTNAASKVAKGDFKGAGYDAIRNVPFGNQIRKTVSGAELIARGYSTDKNGKKTFDAPTSIAGKAQVLAFGPSASKNAQGYYNGTGDKITTTDANGNTRVTKTTQSGITVNKTKNYEDAVSGIKSSYGGKYAELTEEEVKELGKTDADAKDYYKTLQAVKQSSKTPDELPTNLNPLATSIYEKEARLTTDGKDKWNKRPSANKEVNNTIRSWLPKGVDAPRITNATTKQWADYEKKKAEGTLGKLEEESAKRTILRSAYNSVLTEDEKDLYTLSKDKLLDAYDRGVINDQNIDKALKVERQLFDAGLISTETLAKKLGLVARGYKGRSGGRGGRGGSGKIAKDTSVAFSNALQSTTLKRLNSLLAGTQSGGSTSRRVATSKPVLKKISVKA